MKPVTTTTSIKIPKELEQAVLKSVVECGYGLHGKCKWMVEAIEELFDLPNMAELVDVASIMEMDSTPKTMSIRLPIEISNRVEDGIIKVRKEFPGMEGVKGNILRASIIQKLIRNSKYGHHIFI